MHEHGDGTSKKLIAVISHAFYVIKLRITARGQTVLETDVSHLKDAMMECLVMQCCRTTLYSLSFNYRQSMMC